MAAPMAPAEPAHTQAAARSSTYGYRLEKTPKGRYRVHTRSGLKVAEVWKTGSVWACSGNKRRWKTRLAAVWEGVGRCTAEDHPSVATERFMHDHMTGSGADALPDLTAYDIIVVGSSAGKDSIAMLAHVARLAAEQGVSDRIVVVHNTLGTTDTGQSIEWPGVEALAREHAETYGFPFYVRHRVKGGLWDQLIRERKKFPSSEARWCTSDQKTGTALTLVTELVQQWRDRTGITDRPGRVLYCLGLRAQESTARAKKPALSVDYAHSSGNRTIVRWHPILGWSWKRVWDEIKASGLRAHAAYAWGMARLSCSLCVLSSWDDLVLAARLRPKLAADYRRAELQLGHTIQNGRSMKDIIAAAELAGPVPIEELGPEWYVPAEWAAQVLQAQARRSGAPAVTS